MMATSPAGTDLENKFYRSISPNIQYLTQEGTRIPTPCYVILRKTYRESRISKGFGLLRSENDVFSV